VLVKYQERSLYKLLWESLEEKIREAGGYNKAKRRQLKAT